MVDSVIHDLRYGLRQLRRNPGFAAVAVLTLALGIGATTAIFSILDPLLLRDLPVNRPNQLVRIDAAGTLGHAGAWEARAFERLRDSSPAFSGVMAFVPTTLDNVRHDVVAESARGEIVSGNYFTVLGVRPYAGRLPATEQELGQVAVLGFDYWRQKFEADNTVLGKTILVQGTPRVIIGITQPEFFGMRVGEYADIYLPTAPGRVAIAPNSPTLDWVMAIGRLKPGVTPEQARDALTPVLHQIQQESDVPAVEQRQVMDHILLTSAGQGLSALRYRFGVPTRILMGVVGLLLLIACSNVTNLLLARASARKREITMRLALGARRSRLIRQLLTESAVLALTGAAAGLLLAQWTSHLLVSALSTSQNHVTLATGMNGRIFVFSLATTFLVIFLCGLAPALSATRIQISHDIKTYAADDRRGWQARLGSMVVVAQVAMSVTALVAGGLLLHSLLNLETMPVGFDRDHVLAMDMEGNAPGQTAQTVNNFYDRLLEQVNGFPGVRSATISLFAPVSGAEYGINLEIEGYSAKKGEELKAFLASVRPGYFSTLGIELLQGRDFTLQDSPTSPRVAIINRALARHYFGAQDPIGKELKFVEGNRKAQIVGVVADTKYKNLREPTLDLVYVDRLQGQSDPPVIRGTLSVRGAGNMDSLRSALPQLIHSLDSSVRVTWIATLRERIDDSLNADRLIATLCGIFGLLALTLTCIGLYGVLSFRVARSTSEIGIRMALGAERGQIFRLFLGRGMRLVVAGLLTGFVTAVLAGSLIKKFLFGVGQTDPGTFLVICLLLSISASLACFVPAWRAMRLEPMMALRNE
jgi:predicted permease